VELRSSRVMWLGGGEFRGSSWRHGAVAEGWEQGAEKWGVMEEGLFVRWMMKAMWNELSRMEAVVDR
jgi:hypothetical protein